MAFLSWFSVLAVLILTAVYVYWSWREEQARPRWVRNTFYGGVGLFAALFVILTWHTVSVIPARTHAESLTPQVVEGKRVWHKYVCIDCHTLLGNGAYFGPDLTRAWNRFLERSGGDEKTARTATGTFLKNPPQPAADRRGMYHFRMSDAEAEQLTAFLQWISGIDTNGWPPQPARPISRPAVQEAKGPPLGDPGRKLLADKGCLACHSVGGGRVVGPDLNGAAAKYDRQTLLLWVHDTPSLYRNAGRKPLNPGYPGMPNLAVGNQDAEAIAAYLLSLGGKTGRE